MRPNLFQRLFEFFRGPIDPTRDFGDSKKVALFWDFDAKQLNGISFGDSIEGLEQFGRATVFNETVTGKSVSFTFAKSGLFMEFDRPSAEVPHYTFDYFGVLVGPDRASEVECEIDYQSLHVVPGDRVWDQDTERETFGELFGPPHRIECDDEEDVRYYEFDGIEYELEFNPHGGKLKRINVYPFI
ncbi:MAG: hypothetical protein P1U89_17765 [Verrucomicrobiales bacterium]|nr:hypothetical protein [Verrucomicrobiales bacterium]